MKLYLLIAGILVLPLVALGQEPAPAPSPKSADTMISEPLPASKTQSGGGMKPYAVPAYVPPDAATRRKRFINSLVGPFSLARTVATAGISTWRNSPEEWGPTWEGYGRRVASNFGKKAIKQTTKFGLDEALKVDSHYYRSKDKSVGARVGNALISPVTARNRAGKRVVGIPNLAGTYASGIIAREAWYPDRYDWKDGVRSGTISLGFSAAFNLFKEFVWKK